MDSDGADFRGLLRPRAGEVYQVSLFSLPREKRIRCQCVHISHLCNKPIYSKIVFLSDGRDYCVQGWDCSTSILEFHNIGKGLGKLRSVPVLGDEQISRVYDLIRSNVADVAPYLIALRDQEEARILQEESRICARRHQLHSQELEAIDQKLALKAEHDSKQLEYRLERLKGIRRRQEQLGVLEQKRAYAESLCLAMANWMNVRTAVSDILAYGGGFDGLHPRAIEEINSNEHYKLLRRTAS